MKKCKHCNASMRSWAISCWRCNGGILSLTGLVKRTRVFCVLALMLSLLGCGEVETGVQVNTQTQLLGFWQTSAKCSLSADVSIASVKQGDGSEYLVLIKQGDTEVVIRLSKTHFSFGGYKLSGVSHDGHFKVQASVNFLSGNGTDVMIDHVDHFEDGKLVEDLYKFCEF